MAGHTHDHAHPVAHGTHVPGTMDITDQARTFAGFMKFTSWAVGVAIVVLVFLALSAA